MRISEYDFARRKSRGPPKNRECEDRSLEVQGRGEAANPRRNVRDRCVDVNQELPAGGMH
jgi:hypothetical protein